MDELKENIQRLWRSAELLFKDEDYTSATILYFKCLFEIMDLIIYQKLRLIPKDHTQRFEILKEDFSKYYLILDKIYSIYRDTYTNRIEKEKCEGVKKNVLSIAKEQGIQFNN